MADDAVRIFDTRNGASKNAAPAAREPSRSGFAILKLRAVS
jgi:hypothetical protein